MKAFRPGAIAHAVAAMLLASAVPAGAQAPPDPAAQSAAAGQLDQLLAPVALYPDGLLGQILMAAGYPLDVVQADRWLQVPGNAALTGDQLAAALAPQPWDPSVKSLVPFPQILHMMDNNLDWMERLGEAFAADQAAVMDAVQELRQQAEAAGTLHTSGEEVVGGEDGAITIAPPNPDYAYVPDYNPEVAFGPWPYPEYPPYYFPGYCAAATVVDFGLGWCGFPIILPLWGWHRWHWHEHRIEIDRDRFAALNRDRPPPGGGAAWQHDPSHRGGVPYRQPSLREAFPRPAGTPDTGRSLRGYPVVPQPAAPPHIEVPRVEPPPRPVVHAPAMMPLPPVQRIEPPAAPVQRMPPAFESFGRGADVQAQAERGRASQAPAPRPPAPQPPAAQSPARPRGR